ncbi:MAG: response regulator transcription factor [Bacteroidetes bacterium]|nr:response regulator transcription factor [Bacteroidota bacterium]
MEKEVCRIIIADDHAVVRTGLQLILDETPDLSIVDEARNGQELLEKLCINNYDLVLLDISMPGKDAIDVLKEIKVAYKELPVVIFSMNPDDIYAVRMIANGASAYINKETKPNKIIEVLRTVIAGRKYFFPNQAEMMADIIINPEKNNSVLHNSLTDREFQIFTMLAAGVRKSEIAEKFAITKSTVSNHRNNILKKMNMSTNSELTRYAVQNGIIQ